MAKDKTRKTTKRGRPKGKGTAMVKTGLPKTEKVKVETPITEPRITREKIIQAFDVLGITSKLDSQKKKELFVELALTFNLNPLKRELHAMEISGILVPEVGYEVYVKRAEKSGRLEYWYTEPKGEVDQSDWRKSTYCVTLIVKRKDRKREQRFDAWFNESTGIKDGKPNSMWAKRPKFMTWKCAVAMLRIAIPEELGEMPYIDAEYSAEMVEPEHPQLTEPQEKQLENLGAQLDKELEPIKPDDLQLKTAREELNAVYHSMQQSKLYTKEELEGYAMKASVQKDNLESLRDLAAGWLSDLIDRKKAKEGK
jgi:hypothetical protein